MRQVGRRDGAHLAVRLRDQHVRGELGEKGLVDFVERLTRVQKRAHAFVDLAAGARNVEGGTTHRGEPFDPRWMVAFVGPTDERVGAVERADELGGAREERYDARGPWVHGPRSTTGTRSANTNPSRSTTSPLASATGLWNIGPS